MNGLPIAVSWSGGKDSCLALQRAVAAGAVPRVLLTVFDEAGQRSRSHGLRPEVLAAQAACLGVPLRSANASWQTYEAEFCRQLVALREQGVRDIVFGDIDLQPHRDWEERVCAASEVVAHLPLWGCERRALLDSFWRSGASCRIVAVQASKLTAEVLGAELTPELAARFAAQGIDACGENGEFHTVAVSGPLFRQPLALRFGEVVEVGGYLAIDALVVASA